MAKKKSKKATKKKVETLTHSDDKRMNIPTAELESVVSKEDKSPIRVSFERRNPDLDPQLVWRGKENQTWSELVVGAPPLYIQEKVHPKVLLQDLLKKTERQEEDEAMPLFRDLYDDFNGLPENARSTEFYQHEANWTNRMILGDSLQVMASLAEREGLRGQVQCIYLDPPYGIKFDSNFQWSTTSKSVTDGKEEHITREPEQVKAFRDTWRDGIHSYLNYLRDRFTVARDLLADSGSIFVQIGEQNVHRIRAILDEVFGDDNCVTEILVKKKGSQKGTTLEAVNDFILWYGKSKKSSGAIKTRPIFDVRDTSEVFQDFPFVELSDGERLKISELEERDGQRYTSDPKSFERRYPDAKLFAANPLKSGGYRKQQSLDFEYQGRVFPIKPGQCWKHTVVQEDGTTPGMTRLAMSGRLHPQKSDVRFVKHTPLPSIKAISNWWDGFGGASNQVYVVQTNERVIERCLLMSTDPGDLVVDPTCGSGTTAVVAEKWGRRWITIDTSRVALALARSRIMGTKFPYYLLVDSEDGQRKLNKQEFVSGKLSNRLRLGFVYRRAVNVTSGSIANNTEIETIWETWKKPISLLLSEFNDLMNSDLMDWQVPIKTNDEWPKQVKTVHAKLRSQIVNRQKAFDDSINAQADYELLFDRPFENNKKVRVAGPFTVESLSPHRTLAVNFDDELLDPLSIVREQGREFPTTPNDFVSVILENLRTAGVQQAHKEDKIEFSSLVPWPGHHICAEGKYAEGESEKRAGIFVGPEFGTVNKADLTAAAREAGDAGFDVLITCAFSYGAHCAEFTKLGALPVLQARMNADLHMAEDLKNTGKGNLFVIFGEPDIDILYADDNKIQVKINGVDVFHPNSGEVRSDNADGIACWFIDTDYNEESFFVRHAYFLGANDPYKSLNTTLKTEINEEAWATLNSDTSRPFAKPSSGRIAVKVINHLGDEVMKVFKVE